VAKLVATLYTRNLTEKTVAIPNLLAYNISSVQFGTQMPGGFATCSFTYPCGWIEGWPWYHDRFGYHLEILEGITPVWEGRLEDVELTPSGVNVTFYGYYSSTFDSEFNDTTSYISGTHYAQDIIRDIIESHCPKIHRDFSNLQETYFNVAPITFTDNARPGDALARLGNLSTFYTNIPWYTCVWEGRAPYFQQKKINYTEPDWHVRKQDLADAGGFSLRRSLGGMYNKTRMIYNTYDGMRVATSYASDTDSQTDWDLTREISVSMGEGGTETSVSARDAYLADHKQPPQSANIGITDRIQDKHGVTKDLWHVRAGDILMIDDLVPQDALLEMPQLDQMRTFWIQETNFSLDSYTLTITPGAPGPLVEVALARAELGARF